MGFFFIHTVVLQTVEPKTQSMSHSTAEKLDRSLGLEADMFPFSLMSEMFLLEVAVVDDLVEPPCSLSFPP